MNNGELSRIANRAYGLSVADLVEGARRAMGGEGDGSLGGAS